MTIKGFQNKNQIEKTAKCFDIIRTILNCEAVLTIC